MTINRLVLVCFCVLLQQLCSAAVDFGKSVPHDSFDAGDTLVFLQTVWRHGDRTPQETFPADPNKKWERGWGELTFKGMEQHVRLGQRLKQRYTNDLNFTSSTYQPTQVYIRSTDLNRTLLSATSNLIGFFSGTRGKDYPDIDGWPQNYVPVPIHTPIDFEHDAVGNPLRPCKRSNAIFDFIKDAPELQKLQTDNQELMSTLSRLTKYKVTLFNVWFIFDAWYIDKDNNRTMPDEFTEELFNKTRDLVDAMDDIDYGIGIKDFKNFSVEIELKKIRGGHLLTSLIGHMRSKIYCLDTPAEKRKERGKKLCKWMDTLNYYAYSSHDITIAALFALFDFKETNWDEPGFPHYSACVSIELWKNAKGAYYIKVYYWVPAHDPKNKKQESLKDLTKEISGCTDKCLLDTFEQRSEKYKVVESNDELCDNTNLFPTSASSSSPQSAALTTTQKSFAVKRSNAFALFVVLLLWPLIGSRF